MTSANPDRRPLVSVILPVYNGSEYLGATLDSLLAQTLEDFEVVAVDDGSKDDSVQILESYGARDRRVHIHRNPGNLGHGRTSNRALELCRGRYIARQDQDDLSIPERLEMQVDYLEEHPEVGLLATAYHRLKPGGRRLLRRLPADDTGLRWRHLFGCAICHSTVMLRAELRRSGELHYAAEKGANDYDLWVRLMRHTRGAALAASTVLYRDYEEGMLATQRSEVDETEEAVSASQLRELLSDRPLSKREVELLRRCSSPAVLRPEDLFIVPLFLDLFHAFGADTRVDPVAFRRIRDVWVSRLLRASIQSRSLRPALLAPLLRRQPGALMRATFLRLPLLILRSISGGRLGRRALWGG